MIKFQGFTIGQNENGFYWQHGGYHDTLAQTVRKRSKNITPTCAVTRMFMAWHQFNSQSRKIANRLNGLWIYRFQNFGRIFVQQQRSVYGV